MIGKFCKNLVLLTLSGFLLPLPVSAEDYQFINPQVLENNPHGYCTPIINQTLINSIPITQIVGYDCQSYVNGAFQLEAIREQEETKRKQIEINGKLTLIQFFVPRSF